MSTLISKKHSLTALRKKLKQHYNGQKVAVAGGAGFVGRHLVNLLSDFVGVDGMVMVLDDFSRGMNVAHHPNVYYVFQTPQSKYMPYELLPPERASRLVAFKGDTTISYMGIDVRKDNYSYLLEDVSSFFNLAAVVAGVLHNQNHHFQMFDDNMRVLTGPLRACEQAGVPAFFQTSSVCVYAEAYQSPCDDYRDWGGDPNPANVGYATAKRNGELAASWANIERVVIGRPSNIIGPHDYFDSKAHVVPAFIHRSITTQGTFVAYGSATVQREFIFSWDVALGMATAMAFGENREAYNIGTWGDTTIAMLSLAHKINSIVDRVSQYGEHERRVLFDNTIGGGDERRYSSGGKLAALGWEHAVDLDSALEMCVMEYLYRGGWTEPDYWKEFIEDV